MNPYANLQFTNPGNAFMQAFQGGQQQRREGETQNALSKYAQDPNNPEAMQGLAKWNPQMALQLQQQKRQEAMRGLEAHRENIIMGAKIIRQIQPKDQAGWQQVLGMAQQVGIDLSEVPQQFDPQYAQGLVSVAEALAPQKSEQAPSAVREYEYYQSLPPEQRPGFDRFRQSIRPQIFGSAEGGYNIYDPNQQQPTPQQGGDMPAVSSPQEAMSLPPGTQFRLPDGRIGTVPGGAGGNASGGFLGPQ